MTEASNAPCDSTCRAIDHSPTVEDYLKAVFALTAREVPASTSEIAARLHVTPSSASTMVARLRRARLLEQVGWGQVRLSEHGLVHARSVVRRHRLLETFLHRVLGMAWDEIHDEAEVLEHHLSRRVEELVDAALGFPDRDPHGDPIPRPGVAHEEHLETPLARSGPGDVFLVQRIYDTDSEALRHLARLEIGPGSSLEVGRRATASAALPVRVGARQRTLSGSLVDLIHGRVLSRRGAS